VATRLPHRPTQGKSTRLDRRRSREGVG
jgi:hypothetical protein